MSASAKTVLLTVLAMSAFAGNSLLCRLALKETSIDAASFTAVRLVSGALALYLIARRHKSTIKQAGSWPSALALFIYAAAFSFAYLSLPAATGALLLFGAVQATMIGYGLWSGERLSPRQITGLLLALGGLVMLMLPGLAAPPLQSAILMGGAGVAWGVYSLRAKGTEDPTNTTAGNFIRAVPLAIGLCGATFSQLTLDETGLVYALLSGALTSGIGYAIWYAVINKLNASSAASVQLSVPALAAFGGIVFLGEPVTLRLLIASTAVLGGIALLILKAKNRSEKTLNEDT